MTSSHVLRLCFHICIFIFAFDLINAIMSVFSSRLFAINIVDAGDGKILASDSATNFDPSESRLQQLESQLEELKQWKTSFSPNLTSTEVPSFPSSLSSLSSVQSEDFQTSETILLPPLIKPQETKSVAIGTQRSDHDVASRIMGIIQGYGQNEKNSSGDAWLGRFKFEPRVRKAIDSNQRIPLVLPAFPWKSVNKVEKVFGALPDLGEVLGLGRLNNLCEDIQEIYAPGARVTVTSDGLVYNDLIGIPDEEVFEYGAALRQMSEDQGYKNIDFIRIMNLLGMTDQVIMTKEEYLSTVGRTREILVERFLDPTFIATQAIEEDRDINLTYCGYIKFLSKDLMHSPITAGIVGKNEYKRVVKQVAQDMITRGKAFAAAIEVALPDHVRLSIHRSTGLNKLSFPLVPQPSHFSMTPWHCSIAMTAKGEFRTAHKSALVDTHDVIEANGRPYYFRDRSTLWDWEGVEFIISYPKTLIVRAKVAESGEAPRLGEEELKMLKALGKGFSPIIVRGFAS